MSKAATDLLHEAVRAQQTGEFPKARALYEQILESQPNHADANHNLGVLQTETGKSEQALPLFEAAIEANPGVMQYWTSYVRTLLSLNRIKAARGVFQRAKTLDLDKKTLLKLEQYIKAAQNSSHLSMTQPTAQELLDLCQTYERGDLNKTLELFVDKLQEFPNSVSFLKIGAAANAQLGNAPEAIKLYQRILMFEPDAEDVYVNLGILYVSLDDPDSAIENFKIAINLQSTYVDAYLNLASTLQQKGLVDEAIKISSEALSANPNEPRILCNLACALKEKGLFEQCIENCKRAISISPEFAEAHLNLGSALQELGSLEEASVCYQKALTINPEMSEAHSNLGLIHLQQGDLDEAIRFLNASLRANPESPRVLFDLANALYQRNEVEPAIAHLRALIKLCPDMAHAHNNLGCYLKKIGQFEEALVCCCRALEIEPSYREAYYNIAAVLRYKTFSRPVTALPNLAYVLLDIITNAKIIRPNEISSACLSLLKLEPRFRTLLDDALNTNKKLNVSPVIETLSEIPLLLELMSVCFLADYDVERFFTAIRAGILFLLIDLDDQNESSMFELALALQCFSNEYIYAQTDEETRALQILEERVHMKIAVGDQPNQRELTCLASYKPLSTYSWCHSVKFPKNLNQLEKRHILDPLVESQLQKSISRVKSPNQTDETLNDQSGSQPYPRWENVGLSCKPESLQQHLNATANINISRPPCGTTEQVQILILGCKTGQDAIETASKFTACNILAVDPNTSNLAYALRKTKELGLSNIEFRQAEMTDFDHLSLRFDVIVCSEGVLNLKSQESVWVALTDSLKPHGLMKISVHSKSAREAMLKTSRIKSQQELESMHHNTQSFRQKLMLGLSTDDQLQLWGDFYVTSAFQNLLLSDEYLFTIPQISDWVEKLGMEFCGFETDLIETFLAEYGGAHALTNLELWDEFEQNNPNSFAGHYQFWCQKPNNFVEQARIT